MEQPRFVIRKASEADLKGIMDIMGEAKASPVHPEWFVDDNEEYVKKHLEGEGFVLVAQAESGEIAGFFLVKKPEPEENLGTFLEFDGEQLSRVMIMDTAAVAAKYRGNGLQSRLCRAAVECIDSRKYQYLLCTIHPDNCYSLRNMQENGFAVQKAVKCYGGLDRYILMRELSPEK